MSFSFTKRFFGGGNASCIRYDTVVIYNSNRMNVIFIISNKREGTWLRVLCFQVFFLFVLQAGCFMDLHNFYCFSLLFMYEFGCFRLRPGTYTLIMIYTFFQLNVSTR